MVDIIVPVPPTTTTQKERRCSHVVCANDLDMLVSEAPTLEELAAKYSVSLVVFDEPQDADGNKTGPRIRVPDKNIPMNEVLSKTFTAGGVTLPGVLILALFNEITDAYKGDRE